MELVEDVKELLIKTAKVLKGSERRCVWHEQYEHWEKEVNCNGYLAHPFAK